MKRIKVLHQVLNPSDIGGVSSEFKALQQSSLSDRYEFESMVLYNPHKWINIHDIYFYFKNIRVSKPDIVHIRGAAIDGLNAVIAAKLYRKAKIFVAVHGMASDKVFTTPLKKWINKNIIEYLTFSFCDGISCVCKNITERQYFNKYRKKMLPFVYNRIPSFEKENSRIYRNSIRTKYQIPIQSLVFIFVGRLTVEKGIDDMFAALDLIQNKLPKDFVMLVVGGGNYYEQCKKKYINKPYHVIFTDTQKSTEEFYYASDVFILPSLHENHSISLLEACAAKLPCIVTDCGGNAETIENNLTGLIVPVGNIIKMSEAMLQMISTEFRNRCSKNMQEYDFSRFSDKECDKALDQAYKTILEK